MAIGYIRSVGTNSIPIWQGLDKDIQLAQGGFAVVATGLANDSIIPAGTAFVFDESARTATMYGGAVLQANATNTATTYQVNKGHTLIIGNYLAATSGAAAYAITAIDTSNAAYDVITVGTTLGVAFTAGQTFFVSTATGSTAAAYAAINGLSYDDIIVNNTPIVTSVSIVIRGTVYARRIPYTYSTGLAALTGLKNIIFSQSK